MASSLAVGSARSQNEALHGNTLRMPTLFADVQRYDMHSLPRLVQLEALTPGRSGLDDHALPLTLIQHACHSAVPDAMHGEGECLGT